MKRNSVTLSLASAQIRVSLDHSHHHPYSEGWQLHFSKYFSLSFNLSITRIPTPVFYIIISLPSLSSPVSFVICDSLHDKISRFLLDPRKTCPANRVFLLVMILIQLSFWFSFCVSFICNSICPANFQYSHYSHLICAYYSHYIKCPSFTYLSYY